MVPTAIEQPDDVNAYLAGQVKDATVLAHRVILAPTAKKCASARTVPHAIPLVDIAHVSLGGEGESATDMHFESKRETGFQTPM
ncbi:unnamed protein product [Nippostrongylus brasiliensis]|uniref:Uncharacterized protein n=1 Tax=Nippostrongylus brasiliensis TaxID=27835 RepID=A0A0N4XNA8_NIPBR|nr:unnamed protein product [Nippostrongylus brasiliensis]